MDELDSLPPDDLPLSGLIDRGATVAPRPDALREIVARQERWRVRTLAGALAAVLLGGPVAGYALAQVGSTAGTAVAARSTGTPAASPNAGAAAAAASGGSSGGGFVSSASGVTTSPATPPRQLFIRTTADGVRIRGYLQPLQKIAFACGSVGTVNGTTRASFPPASTGPATKAAPAIAPAPPCPAPASAPATCQPANSLEAQVSNDQVAGATDGMPLSATAATQPLTLVGARVVGAGDPTPIGTILLQTGAGVASVHLSVTGGSTDAMAPVDGYAILATALTGLTPAQTSVTPPTKGQNASGAPQVIQEVGLGFPKATVEALDGAGKVLATIELPSVATLSAGPVCFAPAPPSEPPVPAGAPGSSGSVSSGGATSAGGSSTGTASNGSASATTSSQG